MCGARLDGGEVVLDGLAALFFSTDRSSIGLGSYDSLAGRGVTDQIAVPDIEALNRTMRARTPRAAWADLFDRRLDWLAAIPADLDLIEADDNAWRQVCCWLQSFGRFLFGP